MSCPAIFWQARVPDSGFSVWVKKIPFDSASAAAGDAFNNFHVFAEGTHARGKSSFCFVLVFFFVCPSKQFYHWKKILKFSNLCCSQKGAGETCKLWSLIKSTFVWFCDTSVLAFRHSRHCRRPGSGSVAR